MTEEEMAEAIDEHGITTAADLPPMKGSSRSPMDFELITVAQDAGIATLTLNRPNQLNAVSMQMAKEVIQACDELEEDLTVSCVVLNGAGRAFCAGAISARPSALGSATTDACWMASPCGTRSGTA